ncbi:MAG TPA: hypothetical protein EYO33_14695 [Phycisphaerales bacterium]|nr:hypothetical protein [Phycisphaerales bacterium]
MSLRSDWENLAGADELVKDGYPILGEEQAVGGESLSQKTWKVRVVLRESLDEERLTALSEGVAQVLVAPSSGETESLKSCLRVRKEGSEARIEADLQMLRNMAEIQRLQTAHPEVATWVLVTNGSPENDPETLVGETLKQLTGVLAGCQVIEIVQAPGESFSSLWHRVNVSRLLSHESELGDFPDPLAGAGLFSALASQDVSSPV